MKMYYITLKNQDEAKKISFDLLERRLAVCTNWFPMTCAYRWQGEIKEESEIVLIIQTESDMREEIEKVISQHITYTNIIAELNVHSMNASFLKWFDAEVPEF
jgi:periplasmic divalent cation tolerance protein